MQWKYRELKENRRKHCTRKLAIQTIALGEPTECTQIHDCSRQKSATEKLHRCSFKLRKIKSFKTLYHCKKSMAKSTEKKKQKNYLMGELRNRLVAQLRRRVGKAREGEQGTHARHNAVRNYREVKALGGGTAWSGRVPPAGPRTLKQPAHQTTHPHHTKTLENSPWKLTHGNSKFTQGSLHLSCKLPASTTSLPFLGSLP